MYWVNFHLEIGFGSCARVFAAGWTRRAHGLVAKMVHDTRDPFQRAALEREIEMYNAVGPHAHLCELVDSSEGEWGLVLLFKRYGATLHRLIPSGGLPRSEVALIVVQLASALAHVHGRGRVHRDVKPDNAFARHGSNVRDIVLGDFGVAGGSTTHPGVTQGFVGTPGYMAPELLRNGIATYQTDVYALGVTALHCVAGHLPRIDRSMVARVRGLDDGTPVGRWLSKVIEYSLDPQPEGRPAASEISRTAPVDCIYAELEQLDAQRERQRLLALGAGLALFGASFAAAVLIAEAINRK